MSSDAPPQRPARAGASAQQMYDDERKAWVKRNKHIFRIVDAIVAAVIVASFFIWRLWPFAGWYAGLIAGMALCFDLAARMNPPTWIEQWQSGAYGEQRTGNELEKLPSDWLVMHDLTRANGTNIDHVLVGPPGVFLLDSKNIGTEVRIDGDELAALRPDGRVRYRKTSIAGSARGAAMDLSRALTKAGAGCWVHAVVVVWGDMPQAQVHSRALDWVSGTTLTEWLSKLPSDPRPDRLVRARAALREGRVQF